MQIFICQLRKIFDINVSVDRRPKYKNINKNYSAINWSINMPSTNHYRMNLKLSLLRQYLQVI